MKKMAFIWLSEEQQRLGMLADYSIKNVWIFQFKTLAVDVECLLMQQANEALINARQKW